MFRLEAALLSGFVMEKPARAFCGWQLLYSTTIAIFVSLTLSLSRPRGIPTLFVICVLACFLEFQPSMAGGHKGGGRAKAPRGARGFFPADQEHHGTVGR